MRRLLAQHQIDGSSEYESSVWEYQHDIDRQRRSLNCLLLIPLVMVVCWTPSSIRRLIDIVVPDWGWMPLDYLCIVLGPLQGALNALIYGLTPAVRDALFGRLDHSAQKLRGVQKRLRALRPGRGRGNRRFHHLDETNLDVGAEAYASASVLGSSTQQPQPRWEQVAVRELEATRFGRSCDEGLTSDSEGEDVNEDAQSKANDRVGIETSSDAEIGSTPVARENGMTDVELHG